MDLQTHCLWHFETTRGKDTSEMEWSAFCQPSLVSVMRSTRQNREAAAGSALEQLQGFSKGKGGKQLMEPPKCKYNSLQPVPPLYSDLYGFSALGMLVNDRQVSLVRHVDSIHPTVSRCTFSVLCRHCSGCRNDLLYCIFKNSEPSCFFFFFLKILYHPISKKIIYVYFWKSFVW